MFSRPTRSLASASLLATLALAGLGGCANSMWYPGGPLRSIDQYTYESTSHYPQTVSLIDTRTDQVIWTVDVPVDQQLVMRFEKGDGDDNRITPDKMVWDVWPRGQRSGEPQYSMNVPDATARRVDVLMRPAPEFPADMKPLETPMPNFQFPEAGR
jgi:hypothetical protein